MHNSLLNQALSAEMWLMACYTANFEGELSPASEIDELVWLTYNDRDRVSPVVQIIFDKLREMNWLL